MSSQGPIDGSGIFRRRLCSYLVDSEAYADELTCSHEMNKNQQCSFSRCPILSAVQRENEEIRRHVLKHTPPKSDNPKISFPGHYQRGRIVIPGGIRLIDWEGEEWVAYVKEGSQWFRDILNDEDFEMLHDSLVDQLHSI